MEGASALLEIVVSAKDQATDQLKKIGDAVDSASEKANNMSTAFKAAGGILLGTGIAGVGVLKNLADAAAQHQQVMASVDATLKNISSSTGTYTEAIGGNTAITKEGKKAIQEQIQALEDQKAQLTINNAEETKSVTVTTGHGKTLKEHTKIVHDNATSISAQKIAIDQQILSLKESEQGVSKSAATTAGFTKIIDNSDFSYATLLKTTNDVTDAYLKLGFAEDETAPAFAQDLRITGNMSDAKTMLATAADYARLKNEDLGTATQQLTLAYAGNEKALKAIGIELPKGAKGMEAVSAVSQAAAGQAQAFAHTYDGAMQILSVTFDSFKEKLGDRLLPTLTEFGDKIVGLISWLNNLSPATYDIIVKFLAFGTAFALIAGPLLLFIGFLPALQVGFAAVGTIILPVIGILAGVGIATYLIYRHWNELVAVFNSAKPYVDKVVQSFTQFWQFIAPRIQIAMDIIGMYVELGVLYIELFWSEHGAKIVATIQDIWNKAIKIFMSVIGDIQNFVNKNKDTFNNFFIVVTGLFLGFLHGLEQFWKTNGNNIIQIITGIWEVIKGVFQFAWGGIEIILAIGMALFTGNWTKAWKDIKQGFVDMWNGLVSFFKGIWDTFVGIIKTQINNMITNVDGVIDGINKASSKLHLPAIPDIPKFENGGYVPQTGLAIVHQGEFVLSKNMLQGRQNIPSSVANTTNNNTPINIYATINQEMDLAMVGNKLAFAVRNSR